MSLVFSKTLQLLPISCRVKSTSLIIDYRALFISAPFLPVWLYLLHSTLVTLTCWVFLKHNRCLCLRTFALAIPSAWIAPPLLPRATWHTSLPDRADLLWPLFKVSTLQTHSLIWPNQSFCTSSIVHIQFWPIHSCLLFNCFSAAIRM